MRHPTNRKAPMRGESDQAHPKQPGHSPRVISPKGGVGLVVVFSGNILGCFTHYHQNRSHYCGGDGVCSPAYHKLRQDWKGFAPVYQWMEGPKLYLPDVLEVSAGLDLQLRGRDLVGETWLIARDSSRKRTGPVTGAFLGEVANAEDFVWFDPLPVLRWLWWGADPILGVPNPLQARPLVPVISAPRPASIDPRPPEPATAPNAEQLERLRAAAAGGGPAARMARRVLAEQAEAVSSNGERH